MFAALDSYYLWQERLFRRLYVKVAARPESDRTDFDMGIGEFKDAETWWAAICSRTILGFYGPVALLLVILCSYFMLAQRPGVVPIQGPKTVTISIQ